MRIEFVQERAFDYPYDIKETTMSAIMLACPLYFAPTAMRGFNSIVYPNVCHYGDGKNYFITSECQGLAYPRLYSIRQYVGGNNIVTIGKFQQYTSLREAEYALVSGKAFESEDNDNG